MPKKKDPHYGSNIQFKPAYKGKRRSLKYRWLASFHIDYPETIFIHQHSLWKRRSMKKLEWMLIHTFSHEPIHQILFREGLDPHIDFDKGRKKFFERVKFTKEEEREVRSIF